MNKHASQPRAIYYVVALQIWEYLVMLPTY